MFFYFPNIQATVRGPGLVFILPFLERVEFIDIRTKVGMKEEH